MNRLENILSMFPPVSLADLDGAALLNRMDTKFIFRSDRLEQIMEKLKGKYRVLDIDGKRMFNYESLYFDTPGFMLYNNHLCGKLNRYKIRYRKYVESEASFFEIKFKNNKGRTLKNRIAHPQDEIIRDEALKLLNENTPAVIKNLEAMLWINYTRITMISTDNKEKLTLDTSLAFKCGAVVKTIPGLVIAEVKQAKVNRTGFSGLMKEFNIREGSFSKYCMGVATLFKEVRANNLKEQFLYLNKILYAAPTGS